MGLTARWFRRGALFGAAFGAVFCVSQRPGAAQAPVSGDATPNPLAGHEAEYRQAIGETDPLRRPLFFDPVDIEGPNPGVPCDHLAVRRPEVIAGAGWVALMESQRPPKRAIRYWLPPSAPATAAEAEAQARKFAAERIENAEISLVALRRFVWCK